ncbi:MAG: hypothetical protein AAGH57_05205 [Pseudomonadota bacterium]
MSKATGAKSKRIGVGRLTVYFLLLVAVAVAIAAYVYRAPIAGYAQVSVSYSARVACSCRFIAGRSLEDCAKDKLGGMELVTLVDDPSAKSVTARFPLLASDTATYREGYGCVLQPWEG